MGTGDLAEGAVVARLVQRCALLETAAATAEAARRVAHNQLVELCGNVRALLRVC